jgi:hypothetical protein
MRALEEFIKRYTLNPVYRFWGKRKEKKIFSKQPIVILAAPRSGTTLLLSILDAFPNIFAIPKQTYGFARWQNKSGKWFPQRIDRIYREIVKRKIPNNANRWCEKTPRHIQYIDKILDSFPHIKVIHIIRDGRDVVTSKHPLHRPDEYWVSVNRWVKDVKIGLKYANHPNVLTLKYEDLIFKFDKEIKKIAKFLDEDFTPTREEWILRTSVRESKHWRQPLRKLSAESIGRWKKKEHAQRVEDFMKHPEAVKLMKKLNYIHEADDE